METVVANMTIIFRDIYAHVYKFRCYYFWDNFKLCVTNDKEP